MTKRLLFAQFYCLAIVAILHLLGLKLYLYWVFFWYDFLVHFLGGVWAGLAICWALSQFGWPIRLTHVVLAIVAIGIGWEIFEIAIGAPREPWYGLDTAIDLLLDALGGLAGYWYAARLRTQS